jgi:carbon-monoxide dehydrogenase medium subunit
VSVKPAPFSYHAPRTLRELLELAAGHGEEGRVLAGGQSLMPLLNMRQVRVGHLIDLNGLSELDTLHREERTLAIGALARQARALADPLVRTAAPALADALELVASPTVRNRGTVCGSIAFAQPGAELPAVALAMGGEVVLRHADGERRVGIGEFFLGPFLTALRAGEVVTELRLELWPATAGHAFLEVSRMRLPIVSAAALVELDGAAISRCAVALAGVAGRPVRAEAVEAELVGSAPSERAVAAAAGSAAEGVELFADVHGSPAYRARVARVLVRRAVLLAVARAREAGT